MRDRAGNAMQKLLGVFLTFLLAFQPLLGAAATSIDDVTVASAPLVKASSALNGMVRVYLSSLGSPTTLHLTVVGNYTLSDGTSLTSGESLTVGFSSSTGALTLTRNGTKLSMGKYFALRRHTTTGTNGIKIAESRKPTNPYPGDLSFQAVQQNSGIYKLYTIAHVYIENYLYGVLPYEMGTSAPAEALKAQAVAARTYTVRMMLSRTSGYYDVVDTTGDQTYNGTPSGCDTCVTAVDATKGIVVKNGTSYTATYYSASNGGQTESILNLWNLSGYSYLDVHDDPFDYNNPDSTMKKTTVYASCSNTGNNASLMALLKTKAVTALQKAGYAATSANTSLTTVKSVAAHTPMYASPSRLYTKMDFTLTASTANASGTTTTATVTVTCDIFSELESMLSMSIQSSKNELWSVVKSGSNFLLEARRYGHGLGMSQRGAMYMGKLGYKYASILGFYYTGCTRVSTTFTNTILSESSDEEITSEEEAAGIDDGEDSGACTAVVTLVSSGGSLAIRATKSTSGTILGAAPNSSPVSVLASDGTWCLIRFGSIIGYVPQNALVVSGTPPASSSDSVSSVVGFGKVTASGYLNLRSSASSSASVVSTAPSGAILTIFDKTSSWAHIQYGATVAYASVTYLTVTDTYPDAVASSGSTAATVSVDSGTVAYLRATASTSGTVLAQLADGATVTVTHDDGSWATVTYNSLSGYVLSSCLTYSDSTDTNDTDDDDSTDTASDGEVWATVSADAAYLRAAADESAALVTEIQKGQRIIVTQRGDDWCAARYNGNTGYVLTASLTFSDSSTTVTATVTTQSGSLNMRSEASAGSTILTTIPKGATVTVFSQGTTWCGVTYNGYSGYVMTAFLSFADDTSTDDQTVDTTATVTTTSGSLNLRQLPKTGSTILTTIPRLATVTVHTKGSQWCNVTYGSYTGYAMTAFLTFAADDASDDDSTDTTDTIVETQTAVVTVTSGTLNLRAEASSSSNILARIPNGATLTVLQKLTTWTQTNYNGFTGYVMNAYLTFSTTTTGIADSSDTTAADAADSSDTTTTDTNEASAVTATVYTASGSLNLRENAAADAAILAAIPRLATVTVLETGETWCHVTYGTVSGYVQTTYLQFTDQVTLAEDSSDDTASATVAWVVTPSGSLNLRAAASSSAAIVTVIPRLSQVQLLNEDGDWCSVTYGTYTGYASSAYITTTKPSELTTDSQTTDSGTSNDTAAATGDSSGTTGGQTLFAEDPTLQDPLTDLYATATPTEGETALPLWSACSEQSTSLMNMPAGSHVAVLRKGDEWCEVQYLEQQGFCRTEGLTLLE